MVRLESMVSSAEAMKVASRGHPTFVVATERLGVVKVGPDCRLLAARKTAGLVSSQKVFPQGTRILWPGVLYLHHHLIGATAILLPGRPQVGGVNRDDPTPTPAIARGALTGAVPRTSATPVIPR